MLTRRKPLRSGQGMRTAAKLRRSSRVQPVNRKRKPKRYARDFGEEAERVRAMPCLVTQIAPSEPAHVTSRGAGGGRFDIVPLCTAMHLQQHSVGIESFQACYGLDLRAEADRIAVEHQDPLGIRGLAGRWAAHRDWVERKAWANDYDDEFDGESLDDYEREALLGWVRRRMDATSVEPEFARSQWAAEIAETLAIDYVDAGRLCDESGWPS